MKTRNEISTNQIVPRLSAALAIFGLSHAVQAQTWQTVLNYQIASGQSASGKGLAADSLGNVFSDGNVSDAPGVLPHCLTLKTDTSAVTWYLSDNPTPLSSGASFKVWGLGSDVSGNVYSAGWLTPTGGSSSWMLRKSADSGLSWNSVGTFQYTAGYDSVARTVCTDAAGNVYAAGTGDAPGTKKNDPASLHWVVRKSSNGGQTWATVDDYFSSSGYPKWGTPMKAASLASGLFVVGQTAANANGSPATAWTVRRSINAGATWSTVELFQPSGTSYSSSANGVTSDLHQNIYVAGRTDFPQAVGHTTYTTTQWIIRRSVDSGTSFSNVDVLTPGTGKVAAALAACTDAAGNPVATGYYRDAQNASHWIVRRPDSLGNWQTVDDFQLASGYDSTANDVVCDSAGNLLVTGSAYDSAGSHWIVRRLANAAP